MSYYLFQGPPGSILDRVPPELWEKILNPSVLGTNGIRKASLVCKFFRAVSFPFIFREISINVKRFLVDPSGHLHEWERLEFLTSPRVTSTVKKLKLYSTVTDMYHHNQNVQPSRIPSLISTSFSQVPSPFCALRELNLRWVSLSALDVVGISKIPHLARLSFASCNIDSPDTLRHNRDTLHPICRLKTLIVDDPRTRLAGAQGRLPQTAPWWYFLIDPQTTEKLSISRIPEMTHAQLEAMNIGPALPALRLFALYGVMPTHLRVIPSALSKCPNLEELDIRLALSNEVNPAPQVLPVAVVVPLPKLRSITGPHEFVMGYLRRGLKNLKKVHVDSVGSADLMDELLQVFERSYPGIEHFGAGLWQFRPRHLRKLLDGFPDLVSVRLYTKEEGQGVNLPILFRRILASTKPLPNLVSVEVGPWDILAGPSRDMPLKTADISQAIPDLREIAKRKCPKLAQVRIFGETSHLVQRFGVRRR